MTVLSFNGFIVSGGEAVIDSLYSRIYRTIDRADYRGRVKYDVSLFERFASLHPLYEHGLCRRSNWPSESVSLHLAQGPTDRSLSPDNSRKAARLGYGGVPRLLCEKLSCIRVRVCVCLESTREEYGHCCWEG